MIRNGRVIPLIIRNIIVLPFGIKNIRVKPLLMKNIRFCRQCLKISIWAIILMVKRISCYSTRNLPILKVYVYTSTNKKPVCRAVGVIPEA